MRDTSEFGSWALEQWRRNRTRPATSTPPEKTKPAPERATDQAHHWATCPCTGEVLCETPEVPEIVVVE